MAINSDPNVAHMPPVSTPDFVKGTPDWIKPMIQSAADKYGIPTAILSGLIKQESGFRDVTSPAGAVGYAQFMPETAKGMGVNPHDPESSVNGAAQYLSNAFKKFGKMDLAVASYNAGTHAIEKYQGIPPYKETQNYVKNIMGMAGDIHQSANGPTIDMVHQAKKMAAPSTNPSAPSTPNNGTTIANPNGYNPQISQQGQMIANQQHQTQMNNSVASAPVSQPGYQKPTPPPQTVNVPTLQNTISGVGNTIGGFLNHLLGGK